MEEPEMMEMAVDREARFESIDLTSFLVVKGHRLLGVEGPPQRLQFIFRNIPPADIEAFEDGTALVPAKRFADTRTCLFDLIRARKAEYQRFQQLEPA